MTRVLVLLVIKGPWHSIVVVGPVPIKMCPIKNYDKLPSMQRVKGINAQEVWFFICLKLLLKHACRAILKGYRLNFWFESSTIFILCVCNQQMV